MNGGLQAIFFDFDGIIVDSEPIHYEAFNHILADRGFEITWQEYMDDYIGFDDRDVFKTRWYREHQPLSDEHLRTLVTSKAEQFRRIVHESNIESFPGVDSLIQELQGAVPMAICSGAIAEDIGAVLETLGWEGLFEVVVSADDVEKSKPDPASYRLAIQRLEEKVGRELQAARSVALEDTVAGIRSAKGAELNVVGVGHTYPEDQLQEADWVAASMKEVTLNQLQEWVGGA